MKENLKNFNTEEVKNATLQYFKGDELACDVWIKKYCLKDSEGNLYEKTPDDMHRRISKELYRIESKYPNPISENDIYETLKDFRYIVPQGSPMAGIGNDLQISSISNCFFLEHHGDSYGGIMDIDEKLTHVFKRRGGCGIDLSKLRPSNASVHNAALTSTGAVSFAERYSNTTREVATEGRRAALMISLSINHPDSEYFIDAKMDKSKITGANISLKITDEFMNAVISDSDFIQSFPIDAPKISPDDFNYEYNKLIGVGEWDGKPLYYKKIKAKNIWNKLIKNAHSSAEPGILFWDTSERESPSNGYSGFELKGVNPCAELTLSDSESCRLLVLNLFSFVVNPFTDKSYFDYDLFKKYASLGQRLMDDIVDLEMEKIDAIINKVLSDPEPETIKHKELELWKEINRKNAEGRRTGLGITGTGDLLAAMGLRYGSKEGSDFTINIHKILAIESYKSSIEMAEERGSFPIWKFENESSNPFIKRIFETIKELDYELDYDLYEKYLKYGRRNIANLTIAPTGSVGLVARTSSGLEPVFKLFYKRRRKTNDKQKATFIDLVGDMWEEYFVTHPKFNDWFELNKYTLGFGDRLVRSLDEEEITKVFELSPYYNATANDIDWKSKVEMQGGVQKYIDHSISVTTNLPETATIDDVNEIYITAWKSGCKGHTIYRDGSRDGVLISTEKKKDVDVEFKENHAPKRPKRLKADIHRFQNNLEKWIAVVGLKNDRPYEIFTGKLDLETFNIPANVKECEIVKTIIENENGDKSKRYDIEYLDDEDQKQIIIGLSNAFDPIYWNYAKMLSGTLRHGIPLVYAYEMINSLKFKEDNINSWRNGVARTIKRYIKDGERIKGKCESCGSDQIEFKEGCMTCMSCGSSKCS